MVFQHVNHSNGVTLLTIQASSSDPPIIQSGFSDRIETLLAQFADDDLTRDATYRYEDLVEPTLTGIISRKRREDCIAALKAQILAERAQAADAAAALLTLDPAAAPAIEEPQAAPEATAQVEVQAEPEAQAEPPAPITGNKRNRGQLKSKGSILHNKARGEHAPEYWTVNYKRCRNTFYSQAEAEAALNNYKTFNICPCCDQAPQVQPPQVPSIRAVALAAGVIQVSINGVNLTIDGAFTYP